MLIILILKEQNLMQPTPIEWQIHQAYYCCSWNPYHWQNPGEYIWKEIQVQRNWGIGWHRTKMYSSHVAQSYLSRLFLFSTGDVVPLVLHWNPCLISSHIGIAYTPNSRMLLIFHSTLPALSSPIPPASGNQNRPIYICKYILYPF